jgi:epsin
MLRQFHYIDQNGKDQGVNVRNRAQELAKLLSDVDAIRAERKKARANKTKFSGAEGGTGIGGGISSSSRYGGFGSDTGGFGGYSGEVFGDGGGFGGRETQFSDTQRRGDAFEEYDEEEEGVGPARTTASRSFAARATTGSVKRDSPNQKQKEPDRDLFDFGDEPVTSTSAANTTANVLEDFGPTQSGIAGGDDDFDDFQSATSPAVAPPPVSVLSNLSPLPVTTSTITSAPQFAAPRPVAAAQAANLQGLFATTSPTPSTTITPTPTFSSPLPQPQAQAQPLRPATYQPSGPNYYTSVPAISNPSVASPSATSSLGKPATKPAAASDGGDVFGSLWSAASAGAGVNRASTPSKGPDLASLAKAKSSAGIWSTASSGNAGFGESAGSRTGAMASNQNTLASGSGSKSSGTILGNGLDDLLG